MANFEAAVLTADGVSLVAKAMAGQTTITFTRLATGSGAYEPDENLTNRTALKAEQQSFPFSSVNVVNDHTVYLKALISNENLGTGYYNKEVGVFAQDPDKGEILYSMSIAVQDQWDYIPAYNDLLPSTITLEFYTEVANASSVAFQTGAGAVALAEDLLALGEKVSELADSQETQGEAINELQKSVTALAGKGAFAGVEIDLTIPADGWQALDSPVGVYAYYIDVASTTVSTAQVPIAFLDKSSLATAFDCGLSPVVETPEDGKLRFFAEAEPSESMTGTCVLLTMNGSSSTDPDGDEETDAETVTNADFTEAMASLGLDVSF